MKSCPDRLLSLHFARRMGLVVVDSHFAINQQGAAVIRKEAESIYVIRRNIYESFDIEADISAGLFRDLHSVNDETPV